MLFVEYSNLEYIIISLWQTNRVNIVCLDFGAKEEKYGYLNQ